MKQWESVEEIPEAVGGYTLVRGLDNAFREAVLEGGIPVKRFWSGIGVLTRKSTENRRNSGMTWTSRLKENYQWNHTRREEIRRSRIPLKKELRQNYQLYLMLLPFILLFLLFVIIPVFSAVALSFTYYNIFEVPVFTGFQNYISLFPMTRCFHRSEKYAGLYGGYRADQLCTLLFHRLAD